MFARRSRSCTLCPRRGRASTATSAIASRDTLRLPGRLGLKARVHRGVPPLLPIASRTVVGLALGRLSAPCPAIPMGITIATRRQSDDSECGLSDGWLEMTRPTVMKASKWATATSSTSRSSHPAHSSSGPSRPRGRQSHSLGDAVNTHRAGPASASSARLAASRAAIAYSRVTVGNRREIP